MTTHDQQWESNPILLILSLMPYPLGKINQLHSKWTHKQPWLGTLQKGLVSRCIDGEIMLRLFISDACFPLYNVQIYSAVWQIVECLTSSVICTIITIILLCSRGRGGGGGGEGEGRTITMVCSVTPLTHASCMRWPVFSLVQDLCRESTSNLTWFL